LHSIKIIHSFVLVSSLYNCQTYIPLLSNCRQYSQDERYKVRLKTEENMNIENTQSQMRKGILEFCILSIIRRGEAYPSDIVEEMKAANLNILEGTLYPLLTRLKNANMLTYRWVESNSGPPRKYFSLTEKGDAFYRELEATWNELANAVNALANKTNVLGENNNQ
jgi:PadR family transcriptional regulator PadR